MNWVLTVDTRVILDEAVFLQYQTATSVPTCLSLCISLPTCKFFHWESPDSCRLFEKTVAEYIMVDFVLSEPNINYCVFEMKCRMCPIDIPLIQCHEGPANTKYISYLDFKINNINGIN